MPNTTAILSEEEIAEIAEIFPHAEYQPHLSPDEVPACEFCKGTIDDHKANCVVPHVHALCQTVRALKAENTTLKRHWADTSEDLASAFLKCGELQSRLAEVEKERETLRAENERLKLQIQQTERGDFDWKRSRP